MRILLEITKSGSIFSCLKVGGNDFLHVVGQSIRNIGIVVVKGHAGDAGFFGNGGYAQSIQTVGGHQLNDLFSDTHPRKTGTLFFLICFMFAFRIHSKLPKYLILRISLQKEVFCKLYHGKI